MDETHGDAHVFAVVLTAESRCVFEGQDHVVGFFATRFVLAGSADEAIHLALAMIAGEEELHAYFDHYSVAVPPILATKVYLHENAEPAILQRKGFTFFSGPDSE